MTKSLFDISCSLVSKGMVEGRGVEGAGAGEAGGGGVMFTSAGIPQVATRRECSLCRDTDTHANRTPVPEFIDPVFTKTSPKRSFSLNRKRAFWLVFVKTGSIISGKGINSAVLTTLT